MKILIVTSLAATSFLLCACVQQTGKQESSAQEREATRLESVIDSLQVRVSVLEQQNANQEEHIKDLESDLEDVITFLNNELGY